MRKDYKLPLFTLYRRVCFSTHIQAMPFSKIFEREKTKQIYEGGKGKIDSYFIAYHPTGSY